MRKALILSTVFLVCTLTNGQTTDGLKPKEKHEASFDFVSFYTPVLGKDLYGGNIDIKYYPFKRFATGLSFSMTERKITDTFSYSIQRPILDYYEIGWINQYDLVQRDKIRIGVNLSNGIEISRLGDNAKKIREWTLYGYQYHAREVATNFLYLIQPGVDISYRLYSNKHYPDFYLTTKAKYRYVFGGTKYGELSDFTNFYFGVGISLIGFTDEDPKQNSK